MRAVQNIAAAALLAVASPAAAFDTSARIKLSMFIPVQCELQLQGTSSSETELVVRLSRSCNTWHEVSVTGGDSEVEITELSTGRTVTGATARFRQPERFAETTNTYVIRAADSEHLMAFAANMSVQIDPDEL